MAGISRLGRLASFAIALATIAGPALPQGYGAPFYRAATVEELVRPRAKATAHVVRVKFPEARRDTGADTRNAVRAWADARGLAPGLERFVTHEYELAPGVWVPFLEWRDYREGFQPGDEIRVYLQDIRADRGTPLMLALFAHRGWSRELSQLDEQVIANLAMMGSPSLESEFQPVAAERLGMSRLALEEALESLQLRGLLHRHASEDRVHPGRALTVSVKGTFAYGRATTGDGLSFAGYAHMESLAEEKMRSLGACLNGQAQKRGAPANLADAARECGNPDLAADIANGYRISYFRGAADATGHIPIYSVCAQPVLVHATGLTTYVSQESDASFSRLLAVSPFVRASSCASAAYRRQDGFPVIKHCLVAFATRNPSRGYPPDLAPIGPAGDGCLVAIALDDKDWFRPRFIRAQYDKSYEYRAGKPGPDGRISTFEVHSGQAWMGETMDTLMTEGGEIHAAHRREARRDDPSPDVVRDQIRVVYDAKQTKRKAEEAQGAAIAQHCEAGSMADCDRFAQGHWLRGAKDASFPLWDRACAGGYEASCLFSPRFIRATRERWAQACVRREVLACETWRQQASLAREAMALRLACEGGNATACPRLAQMASQLRADGRVKPFPAPDPSYQGWEYAERFLRSKPDQYW